MRQKSMPEKESATQVVKNIRRSTKAPKYSAACLANQFVVDRGSVRIVGLLCRV